MRPLDERGEGRGGGGIIEDAESAERERLGTALGDGFAAWALGVEGDSGSSMDGGTMTGVAFVGGGWRCFRVPEAVAIEVVVESPFSSTSASAPPLLCWFLSASFFFSLPSVMAAMPPKLCHRSNSHCGGRRMTKTTDATMSEMPSTAIVGPFSETNGARFKERERRAVGKRCRQ
jgi:hypothetical protein